MCRAVLILSLFISLFVFLPVAQSVAQIPSVDFSTVNVDNITDEQLLQLLNKAKLNGLTVDDIVQQAQAKGMPAEQVTKLKERLGLLNTSGNQKELSKGVPDNGEGGRKLDFQMRSSADSMQEVLKQKSEAYRKRIFGAELFANNNLTFEPNLNIPTPGNYIIAAGDVIIVDVYGNSERNDKFKVSPEGYINIPNVGPVLVNGLTIDEAKAWITQKLTSIYRGISLGTTHVQVLLGDIRSIQVMVIGEVVRPGSYTLPSLATVANALYVSGGPDINGSFRDITVMRDGRPVVNFDLYDFLLNGSLGKNILLRDQDIIKVNPYKTRVELAGEVKHPAIFEVKKGESLEDVLNYAGGFTSMAYRGFVRAVRITEKEKEILTISGDSLNYFIPRSGDVYAVDSILDRYTNRVVIEGAISHPGAFALEQGMTVKDLISKADGIREDAFLSRGLIKRRKPDLTPAIVDFNVEDVLAGNAQIKLEKEDSVLIYSKSKIHERFYVVVRGEVNKPDTISYAEGMRLEDAILMSGGFREAASLNQIEVERRVTSQLYNASDSTLTIVGRFAVQRDLQDDSSAASFVLQPFDEVMVRHSPGYHEQVIVQVEGEVLYPGAYAVDAKNERLSDLISKAGGLKVEGYSQGALLFRKKSKEGAQALFESNNREIFVATNSSASDSAGAQGIRSNMDPTIELVGINLDKAISEKGSKYDLYLQEGDIVSVPKDIQTVSVFGEVFYPKMIRFDKKSRFRDYINGAGGFTSSALRKRAYVVYPNGEIASAKKVMLVFNSYPKVKPGSEVFVPTKKERKGLSTQEAIGVMTGVAALLSLILVILKG